MLNSWWRLFWALFFLGAFKFPFSASPGAAVGHPFWHTVLATFTGAMCSAVIFYFSGTFIFSLLKKRSATKQKKPKSKIKRNRFILFMKSKLGYVGLCYLASIIFPLPLGAIVCARFYGDRKFTFPILAAGIFINSVLFTTLWYGLL